VGYVLRRPNRAAGAAGQGRIKPGLAGWGAKLDHTDQGGPWGRRTAADHRLESRPVGSVDPRRSGAERLRKTGETLFSRRRPRERNAKNHGVGTLVTSSSGTGHGLPWLVVRTSGGSGRRRCWLAVLCVSRRAGRIGEPTVAEHTGSLPNKFWEGEVPWCGIYAVARHPLERPAAGRDTARGMRAKEGVENRPTRSLGTVNLVTGLVNCVVWKRVFLPKQDFFN